MWNAVGRKSRTAPKMIATNALIAMRSNVLSTTAEIILISRAADEAPYKRLCVFKGLSMSYVSSLCYFVKLNML
jgi:hypothetical protein